MEYLLQKLVNGCFDMAGVSELQEVYHQMA